MRPLAILAAACLAAAPAAAQEHEEVRVDVELVLAVDVSWSMDYGELAIQRDGYAQAFRSAEVQRVILDGGWGRIAVTFVEWAGAQSQSVVIPWTLIDSRESAEAFAYRVANEEPGRLRRTSISGAIDFAAAMFEGSGYSGLRRIIDISGDGPNNQGRPVSAARDDAAAAGITVNGLPLMTSQGDGFGLWGGIPNLDEYYAECVIGGPGAFSIPVVDWAEFPAAVRRKLVLELAGGWPMDGAAPPRPAAMPVQAGGAVDCLVGERQWQERQMRWDGAP